MSISELNYGNKHDSINTSWMNQSTLTVKTHLVVLYSHKPQLPE